MEKESGNSYELGSKNDPVRIAGREALARTIFNGVIALGDISGPWSVYIGDGASIAADIAKTAHKVAQIVSKVPRFRGLANHTRILDLTPDVPWGWAVAVGTEAAEPFTAGFAPTHAVEAGWQYFGYDKKRIEDARKAKRDYKQRRRLQRGW